MPPTHLQLICRTCADKWCPSVSTICPTVFPTEKCWSEAVTFKMKFERHTLENFLATGGCFECNIYHFMAQGWLKKEEKMNEDEKF